MLNSLKSFTKSSIEEFAELKTLQINRSFKKGHRTHSATVDSEIRSVI